MSEARVVPYVMDKRRILFFWLLRRRCRSYRGIETSEVQSTLEGGGSVGECRRTRGRAESVASRIGNVPNMFQVVTTHSVCLTTGLGVGEHRGSLEGSRMLVEACIEEDL